MKITNNASYGYTQAKNRNTYSKSPNFKSLIIVESGLKDLNPKYQPVIDHIKQYKEELSTYKHWNLKVQCEDGKPNMYISHRLYNNEYKAVPFLLSKAVKNQIFDNETTLLCDMISPMKSNVSKFKEKVASHYDALHDGFHHIMLLTYDNKDEAAEHIKRGYELCNKHERSYPYSEEFAHSFCDYPMFVINQLERMSEKYTNDVKNNGASKQTPQNQGESQSCGVTKESYVVKEADKEVLNGAAPKDDSGKTKGFAKVAGMDELKQTLMEDVILPLQQVELYRKYGIEPINGALLFGPPGCGKTYIAEALAEQSGRTFLKMEIPDTESKYIGETSQNIAKVFKEAEEKAPSIIFIDEVEALAPSRSKLDGGSSGAISYNQSVDTLLQNLNNCSERGIFVIAASNEPQKIDSAIKRVGRIDKTIFVPPPDLKAREELFEMYLKDIYADKNIDYKELAKKTENYTAKEIKQIVVRNAALKALKQNRAISQADIAEEISKYKPQLNDKVVEEYKAKGEPEKDNSSRKKIGFKS